MSEATKHCTHCGEVIPEISVFCRTCGATQSSPLDDGHRTARLHGSAGPRAFGDDEGGDESQGEPATRGTDPEAATFGYEPLDTAGLDAAPPAGLYLDWSPAVVTVVEEAAGLEGLDAQTFVERLVLPTAQKIVATRRDLMSLDEAAELLGIARREVVQMIGSGRLRARKVDGDWRVEKSSVQERGGAATNVDDQIELDLRALVQTSGLAGLETDGPVAQSAAATICYVSQAGVLVCPRAAWRSLGRERIVAEARDAVRRYLRRRERDGGRI
jgi:excisionase family DNA binding protein